jgi:hypothetical protein
MSHPCVESRWIPKGTLVQVGKDSPGDDWVRVPTPGNRGEEIIKEYRELKAAVRRFLDLQGRYLPLEPGEAEEAKAIHDLRTALHAESEGSQQVKILEEDLEWLEAVATRLDPRLTTRYEAAERASDADFVRDFLLRVAGSPDE